MPAAAIANHAKEKPGRSLVSRNTMVGTTGIEPVTPAISARTLVDFLCANPSWTADRTEDRAKILESYLRGEFIRQCGDKDIRELHSGHMLDIIDVYIKDEKPAAAAHMWCALSILWKFALVRRYVTVNPMFGITSPKPNAPRDRVLSDDELKQVWQSLGASVKQPKELALSIQLLTLLPFRGVELLHGRWEEIDFNSANWIVPRERIKTRASGAGLFLMPLPPAAPALLRKLYSWTGHQQFLFPAPRTPGRPVDAKVVGRFIARNIKSGVFEGMSRWTKHDLRRTIATNMGALGVDERIISRCLNHTQAGVTSKYYNLYGYRDEKYEALRLWQDYLLGVLGLTGADNH